MKKYQEYIQEISRRKIEGLNAKPIENEDLLNDIIEIIKDANHKDRKACLEFFIYNTIPGTTSAANVKAKFLKNIILQKESIKEINIDYAFTLLSHMKGGPSVKSLLDIALGNDNLLAKKAANIIKRQVFLYDEDTERLKEAYKNGSGIAKEIIESYLNAEFFTQLPEIEEEIQVVTFVAGIGDISTDLLSLWFAISESIVFLACLYFKPELIPSDLSNKV